MKQNKNNYFGLLIIPAIAVIYGAFYMANIDWFHNDILQAAITSGSETQANVLTPTTQNITDSAMDADGNTIVVWSMADAGATDTSQEGVYYRRFDKNGTALDVSDVLVNTSTTGSQTDPAIASDEDGNFIVVWSGAGDQSGQADTDGVFLQAFQSDGTAVGGEIRVNTTTGNTQNQPAISLDYGGPNASTRLVVSWTHNNGTDTDIMFQRFDADFTQTTNPPSTVGSETTTNTYTTNDQNRSDAAMNTLGEYVITWYGDNGSGNRMMYQVYAQDATAIGSNTVANTATAGTRTSAAADKIPRTDLNDTNDRRFILAYEADFGITGNGIATRRITCTDPSQNGSDTDLNCTQDTVELIPSTDLTGTELYPDVAADYLGNFTVTWEDSLIDSNGAGIAAQSFTYQGKRIGTNFQVNTGTTGDQQSPAIAMNNDGFYTISFRNDNDDNNYFQNYITEIFKADSETLAHTSSANNQASVDTAVAPNGNIAYAWTDYNANSIQFTLKQFNPGNNPPDYTALQTDVTVSSSGNVDNPSVSFFKDTAGTGIGKFIVVWESDSPGNKDIFYQLYNADGTQDGSATAISSNANTQTYPDVAAGYYNPGGTGTGPAITEFAVGWLDETTPSFEAGYNNSGFTFNQLNGCGPCGDIQVDLEPSSSKAIYAWQADNAPDLEIFIRQTTSGALTGSTLMITPVGDDNGNPGVAFVTTTDYVVTYTELTVVGTVSDVYGITYEFGGSGPTNAGTRFDLTQFPATTATEFTSSVSGDTENETFIAVWGDAPTTSTDDFIFGQFFSYNGSGGTNVDRFGPTFRISSTRSGNQGTPSVSSNTSGQVSVAWEGNYSQGATTDSNGVIYQLLQDPQNPQSVLELVPTAQQQITAGGTFLDVPTTIAFPDVTLSTTDDTVQAVSVRDTTYGGDTKYIEIQDATGVDFTFTVLAGDFFSAADGKAYIKNDQHFKVRNWDQDTTGVDDVPSCTGDPDDCYTTMESTRYPAFPTAFTLNSATQSFTFADSQQVLAEKTGTVENEIGRWRIYPEFEITVPPLIPPGAHSAEITFTLT